MNTSLIQYGLQNISSNGLYNSTELPILSAFKLEITLKMIGYAVFQVYELCFSCSDWTCWPSFLKVLRQKQWRWICFFYAKYPYHGSCSFLFKKWQGIKFNKISFSIIKILLAASFRCFLGDFNPYYHRSITELGAQLHKLFIGPVVRYVRWHCN